MNQKTRFSQAVLLVASWMALGWLLHLDDYAYLLLGIPLCILFQLFVRRKPLSSCWVRDTTTLRFDAIGVLIAVVFLVFPVWVTISEWRTTTTLLHLYFFSCIAGAIGVAFALRRFTVKAAWSLLLCLATAGVLGCAEMLLIAFAEHHNLPLTLARAKFGFGQLLLLLPVCFVVEEVAFRGVLDSHVQHPQDSRPWLSAVLLSAMWGWWHLPITPSSAFSAALVVYPITHAIVGVPFSLFWRRSGNLFVPALVHALIDAVRNTYL
jgi:membrane protease YdiL (CAAX protease family)